MFGNKKKLEQKLMKQGGLVAPATVLEAQTKWLTYPAATKGGPQNGPETDHMSVTLRVEPEGQEPFTAKIWQVFTGRIPEPGWTCRVVYDRHDHSKIAVVEGSAARPAVGDGAPASPAV